MFVTGNTYKFRLTATRNGVIWDLTGATVKIGLKSPSGAGTIKTAVIANATGGIVEYDSVVADLNAAGVWSRSWEITQSAIVQESNPVSFVVTTGSV